MAAAQVAGTPTEAPVETAEATEAAPKPAPKAKGKPAPAAGDKPEGEKKPDPKPRETQTPEQRRESNIERFARKMNSDAEKDGVEVNAPENERRAKPGPKPGSKRAPKAEEAAPPVEGSPREKLAALKKPEPAAQAQPTQTAEEDADADAETETDQEAEDDGDASKPEPRATHQLKAKARLRHGDVDKAIRLAFGDLKGEEFEGVKESLAKKLGVSSKQWADYRRYANERDGKAKQLEQNAVQLSQRLRADFEPMIEARKAYAAKNYPKAFELAFGEDINAFQRKAINQHLSQDPEKVRMQQRLDELEARVKGGDADKPKQPQGTPAQQHEANVRRMCVQEQPKLAESEDGEIAWLATKPRFVRRVVELRGEHYDPQSRTTIPLHVAADMARDELRRNEDEWRYPNASGAAAPSSESPALAGKEPVRSSPRARSPNPSLAAQAGGSTRALTREERIQQYAARMS